MRELVSSKTRKSGYTLTSDAVGFYHGAFSRQMFDFLLKTAQCAREMKEYS